MRNGMKESRPMKAIPFSPKRSTEEKTVIPVTVSRVYLLIIIPPHGLEFVFTFSFCLTISIP